jgi:hypothetical protein
MEMNWSRWFRCESSFGLLLVPNQPGVFALAEEVVSGPNGRRMLAVFEVDETDDLALSLSRMFAVGSPWREKLSEGRCFARYAVAPGIADRRAAAEALKQWLAAQRDLATQVFAGKPAPQPAAATASASAANDDEDDEATVKTVAERAVDRVARGSGYAKVMRTGS